MHHQALEHELLYLRHILALLHGQERYGLLLHRIPNLHMEVFPITNVKANVCNFF
jgi:hypothetical protein